MKPCSPIVLQSHDMLDHNHKSRVDPIYLLGVILDEVGDIGQFRTIHQKSSDSNTRSGVGSMCRRSVNGRLHK
jgi:hypothetical protein